ncbi:threonine ammonia-lyase [Prosthecodimorpha staleyi]|uniref:Threonine/serine dehydratase n=1 Tax=Prosthecodimorpha staleyi TaxID=2840188 RepID=A0A947GF73_9HYPH|nr:threonine/serine dehydratase [Prosthecodimorpha staleyi]MBT9290225.1 threonine/serine dehydratase [Prosthecodimorpha staleyi]
MTDQALPTYDDILAAAVRIEGEAVRTPLVTSPALDAKLKARVFLKPECLQRTGSFKFRGAFNAVSQIPAERRANGVVACSSGNHAQGVAAAAALHGLPATIVMPSDAPAIKRERTEGYGATVVSYDRSSQDRDALTEAIAAEKGATLVHPYDNRDVIAGQGTIGLEIVEDLRARGLTPDVVLVCCGGGGLTAGVALAVKTLVPSAAIYPVEPEGFDDQARSFAAGERLRNTRTAGSVCDALLTPMPGVLSFALNKPRIAEGLVVSDAEALAAVGYAARELKLVLEPGGAVALAAALSGKVDLSGKVVAIVLSGGNVDPAILAGAVAA